MATNKSERYCVVRVTKHGGSFISVVSGLGRNRGTLDSDHSRRTAQRHAATLRREDTAHGYRVKPAH